MAESVVKEEHMKSGRQKIAALIAWLSAAIMAVAALSGSIVRHLRISQTGADWRCDRSRYAFFPAITAGD
jgi:hypothetical protein